MESNPKNKKKEKELEAMFTSMQVTEYGETSSSFDFSLLQGYQNKTKQNILYVSSALSSRFNKVP